MNLIEKELYHVEKMIKGDVVKEKSIKEIYKYIFKSDGKKIRARLNLISSSINRKKKNRIKLAAIIELLHTATLVHDDVVDDSSFRRGNESVNNIWSNAHGVLIGDYIYSKAFIYMVDVGKKEILKELAGATNDISQGELIQLDAINNQEITLTKLKRISYFKTGRLFEAAARTGALLAETKPIYIKNISECAKNIGILFQIKDDLLDYSLSNDIGKPVFQDLKEGKVTYPFFFAYKNADKNTKKTLSNNLGNKKANTKDILRLIQAHDGISKTEDLAKKFHKNAIISAKKIDNLKIQKEMIELAQSAYERSNIDDSSGTYKKGSINAHLNINPDLWFFKCHFKTDPVMPGCLGLDAMWQLLGFYLLWSGLPGIGRALGADNVKFFGQVLPNAKEVTYKIDIKRIINRGAIVGLADGEMFVDNRKIYTAEKLKVGLFKDPSNF